MENKTLETASAEAGMCERTGRRWRDGPLPSETKTERTWRTREDPFAEVWESDVVPLLEADRERAMRDGRHRSLQAKTILAVLLEKYPDALEPGQLRTLQRRVRDWRALNGAEKEVMFEQMHQPGVQAAMDFTQCDELGVTIGGVVFPHLLFVFRLAFSKWTWVDLAFGETYEALVAGLQGALWALGGAPRILRHDNLSAATHELKRSGGRALTTRFKAVLDHYGLDSSRITPGESHENGLVEKAHDLIKSTLHQHLTLRGSRDFASGDDYLAWVRAVIEKFINTQRADAIALESGSLQALPSSRLPDYSTFHPTVRQWSTFRLGHRVYSVPSRLIGHEIEVRQYPDYIEVRYGGKPVECIERLRGCETARIDYRHVIWSLVRKPGAFAQYRYREELFPSLIFRQAYDALRGWRDARGADLEYVRILHLAASTMESRVEAALRDLLGRGERFDYCGVKELSEPLSERAIPNIDIPQPNLLKYDELLAGGSL